ncbi:MAG: adenosylmethionine decarboxylase [Verrucomicrobiales bacterium]
MNANSSPPTEQVAPALHSPHDPRGHHLLLEFSHCRPELLTELEPLKHALEDAARRAGATVIDTLLHRFSPQGLSGIVIIAESHLAVHTWPQHQYAAIDIFTCGHPDIATRIHQNLLAAFQPRYHQQQNLTRQPPPNTEARTD